MTSVFFDVLQEALIELGLQPKEATILLACLQTQNNTPTSLSHSTNIKRSTVYFYLDQLEAKGLIYYRIQGKKRFVQAHEPEQCMQRLIEQKKEELDTTVQKSAALIEQLHTKRQENATGANVQQFTGKENIRNVLQELLEFRKDIRWIGNLDVLFSVISKEEFYSTFTLERMMQNTTTLAITDKSIMGDKRFSEMIGQFRKFRFPEDPLPSSSLLGIVGDTVFFFSAKQKHCEAVAIRGEHMRTIAQFLFDQLWERISED